MESAPLLPPVSESPTPWNWARKNLFSSWYNSLLTVVSLIVIFQSLKGFAIWVTTKAQWRVIEANLPLFFAGRFPRELHWRLWIIVGIITLLGGLTWGNFNRQVSLWNRPLLIVLGASITAALLFPTDLTSRIWLLGNIIIAAASYSFGRQINPQVTRWLPLSWVFSFPVILWLIKGGLGLKEVPTNDWGGLMLTLFAAVVSIALSFPLGVLLALGRQSSLPVVKYFSILYIEIVRGLPLIGILFLGQVMLQFFLPPGAPKLDRLVRAIAALTLFSAAYLAENVRGGLQSVPRGQIEAARSLGLNKPLVILLIVLPQALRAVIPAIVGQFIGLFKDTSLLSLFGILELVGISRSVLANPAYSGRYAEVYVFIGVIYWVFCYSMSLASRKLEQTLGVGQK
ncbi:amino acid ABC transporter permease [Kamptonema animale CS-326]|jgi:general L-amino acid transport system permease protein|uniref:amino acid ABC transporter permease n=1 Tax=Kamptonema animale TaxID=92934 RepID=UPI00232EB0C7|nr:amino acid ABC transporter permease [Kamptonema animale]MDB9513694.1 amino acid ABC transporter permease [Kamptonema animale CS-326]